MESGERAEHVRLRARGLRVGEEPEGVFETRERGTAIALAELQLSEDDLCLGGQLPAAVLEKLGEGFLEHLAASALGAEPRPPVGEEQPGSIGVPRPESDRLRIE